MSKLEIKISHKDIAFVKEHAKRYLMERSSRNLHIEGATHTPLTEGDLLAACYIEAVLDLLNADHIKMSFEHANSDAID